MDIISLAFYIAAALAGLMLFQRVMSLLVNFIQVAILIAVLLPIGQQILFSLN